MDERDVLIVHEVLKVGDRPELAAAGNFFIRRRRSRPESGRRVSDYFRTISKATEYANRRLVLAGSRFRFCVYRKDRGVFVDVAELDTAGRIRKVDTREITEMDFDRCIEDLASARGLGLDLSV